MRGLGLAGGDAGELGPGDAAGHRVTAVPAGNGAPRDGQLGVALGQADLRAQAVHLLHPEALLPSHDTQPGGEWERGYCGERSCGLGNCKSEL